MSRPIQITTPTHGMALGAQALVAVLGVLNLTNLTDSKGVTELLGPLGSILWAVGMIAAGITALVAALMARADRPGLTHTLRVEAAACAGITATLGVYVASLFWRYGLAASLTTKTLALALAIGAAVRLVQLVIETRRLDQALTPPALADPAPLADPDD